MSDHGAVQPGWYPDPEGRFEHRYHNGVAWTRDVSIAGRRYFDDGSSPMGSGAAGRQQPRGATAAMVMGIVAATLALLPGLFVVGVGLGIAALVTGVSVRRGSSAGTPRTFATVGAVAGGASLVLSVVGVWLTVVVYRAFEAYESPARHHAEVTACTTDGRVAAFAGTITNLDDRTADFTLRLRFEGAGSGSAVRTVTHEVDDVGPGETREFEVRREVLAAEIDCDITQVDGPLPFGLDLD